MSMWLDRNCATVAAAWLVLVLAVAPARAQSEDDARARAKAAFEQGVADYAAGHYEKALAGFQEALRIRPHPLVNVNIANCYDKLGKPLQASIHFERFLDSGTGSPEQQQEVRSALERLKMQVGKILLRVTPDGATVVIDQGEARTAPLFDPVPLEAGRHTLTARLNGYRTAERTLIVKGGTTLELTIALEPDGPVVSVVPSPAPETTATETPRETFNEPTAVPAPPVTPAEPPATPAEEQPGLGAAVWIAGGLTIALAAAATVTGVLALGANKDFKQYKSALSDQTTTAHQHIAAFNSAVDSANRARGLALATDIMLGGAAAGAVITIILLAQHGSADSEQAGLRPLLSPHAAGLQLRTPF